MKHPSDYKIRANRILLKTCFVDAGKVLMPENTGLEIMLCFPITNFINHSFISNLITVDLHMNRNNLQMIRVGLEKP